MEPPRLPLTPQATTPGPESPGLEPCGLEPERGYDAVPAAVCALGCIFGVVYSCFGIIPRQRQLQLLRIRQQEAKKRPSPGPPEGSYRRKPPPATRFPGDVLAPSYIQSLRDRQLGASASLSSLSAVAPALPERDDDCGSITPLRPLAAPCTRP